MSRTLLGTSTPRAKRVVLAQLSHALNDRNHWFCNKENVPLAAGYLRSLARSRGLDRRVDIEILAPTLSDHAGDAALAGALVDSKVDVLALSLYPWNLTRSLRLAESFRAARPGAMVFAGGPEVNDATMESLLAPTGPIDVALPGEGEISFCEALETVLEGGDLASVAGLALRESGEVHRTADRKTLLDLDLIPSPFLTGDIDARLYRQVHVLFERGCIYSCNYCHWWPDRRSKGRFSLDRIGSELEHLRGAGVEEVIILDASLNTSRRFNELSRVLAEVNGDGALAIKVHVLFDHLDRGQLEALVAGGVKKLEVGLQSTDPDTLKLIRRPTDLSRLSRALELTEGLPLDLQVDFIMGLPGDTEETIRGTARRIRDLCHGRRVAQISPFVLSVGSPTRLRSEAQSHGIRYQPEPPYRVLSVGDIDYAGLRRLRMELPGELGYPEHPCFTLDRPHYYVNLFEPELCDYSSSDHAGDPGEANRPQAVVPELDLVDTIVISCARTEPGHEHPFDADDLALQLAQLVQVRLQAVAPDACRHHIAALLAALSRPNPYTVWDIIIETEAPFATDLLEHLAAAIEHRVHNLDWDNYLVRREEGPGHVRMATRPFAIVPAQVDAEWREEAARRFAVVSSVTVSAGCDVRDLLTRTSMLPGEGMVIELTEDSGPAEVLAVISRLARVNARVRTFRNQALKCLFEGQIARQQGRRRPRLPYSDRNIVAVDQSGTTQRRVLSSRQSTLDMTLLCMGLRPRHARRAS